MPSVNLDAALLVVGKGQPLIRPRTRTHRVRVPAAGRRGVEANLALDVPCVTNLESRDVARERRRV
jgi:hypothetical protein